MPFVQELYKPHDGSPYGKKKEAIEQFTALEPVGRMGQPEEIANAVVWMCSDEASFVTGHAMAVDGGFGTINNYLFNSYESNRS
jgi:NAD(P)-dependent dehydrogenase (short-subunit alcohol dehydrogenase family)